MRLLQTLQANELPIPPLLNHKIVMRARLNNNTLVDDLCDLSARILAQTRSNGEVLT
jgi:hypothetical protein